MTLNNIKLLICQKTKPNQRRSNTFMRSMKIYHHYQLLQQVTLRARSSQTLFAIYPNYPLFRLGLHGCIQCPHRIDICEFLWLGQHLRIHVYESRTEHHLWVSPYFSGSAQRVLIRWFVRWELSGFPAAAL